MKSDNIHALFYVELTTENDDSQTVINVHYFLEGYDVTTTTTTGYPLLTFRATGIGNVYKRKVAKKQK